MATVLIAAALAASLPASTAPDHRLPDAKPAIWVVNDHDTVIFLFGTFHALDGRSEWFNDEVRTAFSASDELILETIIPEISAAPPPAPPPPTHLHSLSITPSASFLASTRMAISAGQSRGMSVAHGADVVLRRAAESEGKHVGGLESLDFQFGMFRRLPHSSPKTGTPVADRRTGEHLAAMMSQMQAAWNRGDSGIFATMLEQMRANSPDTYRVMFTDRNTHWAAWIAQRLQRPGTVFVAVGTGHLAGPDSVQAKLAERGVQSARIN